PSLLDRLSAALSRGSNRSNHSSDVGAAVASRVHGSGPSNVIVPGFSPGGITARSLAASTSGSSFSYASAAAASSSSFTTRQAPAPVPDLPTATRGRSAWNPLESFPPPHASDAHAARLGPDGQPPSTNPGSFRWPLVAAKRSTAQHEAGEDGEDEEDGDCEDGDEGLCVVCMDRPRSVLLLPCGHLVLCGGCVRAVRERGGLCPMCREKIGDVQDVMG
ncbi:hypothetical protein Agub_g9406, partial [Astrephomene gubernaculifera]